MKNQNELFVLYKSITGSSIARTPNTHYNNFESRIIREYSYVPDYLKFDP